MIPGGGAGAGDAGGGGATAGGTEGGGDAGGGGGGGGGTGELAVAPVTGGGGGRLIGVTHPERSKIMNSSAFSCAESSVRTAQQPGNTFPAFVAGSPGNPVDAESLTCKAV